MTEGRATIEIRDDAPHEHARTPGWSERLCFTFFDGATGFGGLARLSFEPAAPAADGSVTLFVPGGGFATVLTRAKPERMLDTAVGRIRFEQSEAMKRWTLRCKDTALIFSGTAGERQGAAAPIDLDLDFITWTPPHGTVARDKRVDDIGFVDVVSTGHFEQAGRVSGRLRLGTAQGTIDGTGVRDRSWGVRDDTARHEASWIAVAFSPTVAFGVRTFEIGERAGGTGWVWADGMRALRSCRLEQTGSTLELHVTDDRGDQHGLEGELLASVPLREGNSHVVLRMARFRYAGLEAIGLFETVRGG